MPRMKYPLFRRAWWRLRGYAAQPALDLLEESQWWPRERLQTFRDRKVESLVRHCYEHVPYYRRVMDERGLRPGDVTTVGDLAKLPVLTKDLVRRNLAALYAANIPAAGTYETRTGGTTGEPMRIRRWPPDVVWQTQCYARGLSWGGLGPDTPRIRLFGGSLGQGEPTRLSRRLAGLLARRDLFLPAFELSRQNVSRYIDRIRTSGLRHMLAYTSACYLLALLAEEAGQTCALDAVFPTAEFLPDAWREKIKRVFSCKVLGYYGCGEVNSLGYECGQGPGLHRCDEHAVIEVANGDGGTALAGEGTFLVTDLDSRAMPILRYVNGDAGLLSDEPCPCGRSLGRILRLDGRVNDMLARRDGGRLSGAIAAHSFRYVQGVELYQFVQDRPGQVLVRIVRTPEYRAAEEEARIRDILGRHLGPEAEVTFEYPEDIERTPAGKARFVINRYLEQQTA